MVSDKHTSILSKILLDSLIGHSEYANFHYWTCKRIHIFESSQLEGSYGGDLLHILLPKNVQNNI